MVNRQPASYRKRDKKQSNETKYMLYTIAVILLLLWVLGLATSYTMGGFIHILLVVALVMVLINVFSGRGRAT